MGLLTNVSNRLKDEVKRYQEQLAAEKGEKSQMKDKETSEKETMTERQEGNGNEGGPDAREVAVKQTMTDRTEPENNQVEAETQTTMTRCEKQTMTEEVEENLERQTIPKEDNTRENTSDSTPRNNNRNERAEVKNSEADADGRRKGKDYSKLCIEYVWNGKCYNRYCKFTHKKLCRELRKEGECSREDCEDGHNVDVICREFRRGKCDFDELHCRFLHLELKETSRQAIVRESAQNPERQREQPDEEKQRNDEEISPGLTETEEEQETVVEEVETAEYEIVDEFFCTSPVREVQTTQEQPTQENEQMVEEQRSVREISDEEEVAEEPEQSKDSEPQETSDFLEMDMKHDIWKELKSMKLDIIRAITTEIKRQKEGKRGGQRQ